MDTSDNELFRRFRFAIFHSLPKNVDFEFTDKVTKLIDLKENQATYEIDKRLFRVTIEELPQKG